MFRRFVPAVVPLLALALLAATPLPPGIPKPTVVVYPFDASGSAGAQVGNQLAIVIANELASAGSITVLTAKSGLDRKDYLAQARSQGADYYLIGSLWAMGQSGSLVSQVVSTQTGIVVFSNSAPVSTVTEAQAQADVLRDGILAYAARNTSAFSSGPLTGPAPTTSATPAAAAAPAHSPQATAAGTTTHALFGSHHHAAAPLPSPSPT